MTMGAPKARYVYRVRIASNGNIQFGVASGALSNDVNHDDYWDREVHSLIVNSNGMSWQYLTGLTLPELRRVCRYIINDGGVLTSEYRDKNGLGNAVNSVLQNDGLRGDLRNKFGDHGTTSIAHVGYRFNGDLGVAPIVAGATPPPPPPSEPEPAAASTAEPAADIGALLGGFAEALRPMINETVTDALMAANPVGVHQFDELADQLTTKVNDAVSAIGVPISVTWEPPHGGDPQVKSGVHYLTPTLAKRVQAGIPMLLHGEAGTGKTTMAHDVADMLGLQVELLPCDEGMMRHDVMGYKDANGLYHAPETRRAYENGLCLVLDEFDAVTGNFAVAMNALVERPRLSFPDRIVDRHPDFRVIACANTIGEGATAQYRGRNALDAATLNRFTFMHVPLDESIETAMVQSVLADRTMSDSWLRLVRTARKNVTDAGLRVMITPRSALDGAKMLALGEPVVNAVRDRLTRGCSVEVADKLLAGTGVTVAEVI